MAGLLYIRMKKKVEVEQDSTLFLKDIARLSGEGINLSKLEELPVSHVSSKDGNVSVIDVFHVIQQLVSMFPQLEIQQFGPDQTILLVRKQTKSPALVLVIVIWLLLFVGAATAIMNFHYDVSMQGVQQKLHFLLTGKEVRYPLWLQIPYSFGLGIGMVLFFNHLFQKRFNEEPSPLEVEMFKYQQDLDSFTIYHENKLDHQHDSNR